MGMMDFVVISSVDHGGYPGQSKKQARSLTRLARGCVQSGCRTPHPNVKETNVKFATMLGALLALVASTQGLAVGRLADITIHDRTENRRLQIHWHEGKAWVVGKPGNEY